MLQGATRRISTPLPLQSSCSLWNEGIVCCDSSLHFHQHQDPASGGIMFRFPPAASATIQTSSTDGIDNTAQLVRGVYEWRCRPAFASYDCMKVAQWNTMDGLIPTSSLSTTSTLRKHYWLHLISRQPILRVAGTKDSAKLMSPALRGQSWKAIYPLKLSSSCSAKISVSNSRDPSRIPILKADYVALQDQTACLLCGDMSARWSKSSCSESFNVS